MCIVSIVMPAYNSEKTIGSAIESVIAQSYKFWELIIVNDCSKDSTIDIIQKYQEIDERIVVVNLSQNGGVVNARNKAIESSKGEYIAFLDSDDLWLPSKLEKQVSFMETNNYVFSYTGYGIMDKLGNLTNKKINIPLSTTFNSLLKGSNIGCLTVMIDRRKVGNIKMPKVHHEDYATWLSILKNGSIAYGIPEVLAYYRKDTESLSGNKIRSASWQWKIYREFLSLGFVESIYYFTFYTLNGFGKI